MQAEEIRSVIHEALNEMIEMYELPPTTINDQLYLIEALGFSSIDIMHLLASLDMRFERHFPYDHLVMKDGEYVKDLSVGDIEAFIIENFDTTDDEPRKMS